MDFPQKRGGTGDDQQKKENQEPIRSRERRFAGFHRHALFHFDWWWEAGALLVATANIAAILAVLAHTNNKFVADWEFSIQPASLIAVFSTIAKASLLVPLASCLSQLKWKYFENPRPLGHMQAFDDASRGPWGSAVLLWETKGTAAWLASAGASLTILLLAFGPFTQQVIQFEPRNRTMRYGIGGSGPAQPGFIAIAPLLSNAQKVGPGAEDLPIVQLSITLGMMAAMADMPSTYQSRTHCPTARCSFEDFTTLGACTTCESETATINNYFGCDYHIREEVSDSSPTNVTIYSNIDAFRTAAKDAFDRKSSLSHGMNCTRKKEGYPTFGLSFDVNLNDNGTRLQGLGQRPNQTDETLWPDTVFGETNNTFLGILSEDGFNTSFTQSRYRFCTSGYGRSGLGGKNEAFDTFNTYTCFTTSDDLSSLSDLSTFGEMNATLKHCRISLCAQDHKNVMIESGQVKVGSVVERTLMEVGHDEYFNNTFATAESSNFSTSVSKATMAQVSDTMELVTYSPSFQEFIIAAVDLRDWPVAFERIAASLSSYVRSSLNPNVVAEPGHVHSVDTVFRVRWAWLVLPLALLAASAALLVCTIVANRGNPLVAKSSVLVAMVPRLEKGQAVELGAGDRCDEAASRMDVAIVRNDVGGSFELEKVGLRSRG